MRDYILKDEWNIIEDTFDAENNRISESIFSIGNGHMGQRANFEESYSGDSLQGSYLAGIYYPDKTRVGWWKNGYPEYFAKVVNSINWIGIRVTIDGQELDLAKCLIHKFERRLDMKNGILSRFVEFTNAAEKRFILQSKRITSIAEPDAGLVQYSIQPLTTDCSIILEPYLDGNVTNEDSNYDEHFWSEVGHWADEHTSTLCMETAKTKFQACASMSVSCQLEGTEITAQHNENSSGGYVAQRFQVNVPKQGQVTMEKYVAMQLSINNEKAELPELASQRALYLLAKGLVELLKEHSHAWHNKWQESDIIIEGDVAAQQAIRYNIFQLYQTYTGDDQRLNIGPKGFTGEKYGGVTYWDTEAYCLPFYLRTADKKVARNLLQYRYDHLPKAIENAAKLGFNHGAALYPMVTINGEECHNEWEITFEEIHRNGAIAYAIFNYVNYTGDQTVIADFALEVLIAISRFWSQRVNWSEEKQSYVMLGVTGPNEYENNVNNNWYTNTIARWTLTYTIEQIDLLKENNRARLEEIYGKVAFSENQELDQWQNIIDKIHRPYDEKRQVFLQQDNFLDKELIPTKHLPASDRPIHKKWSWDRILRSCYIKQADVLQGLYMLEADFDKDVIKRNFDFYEPLTVHESSLSASIHSILASSIGYSEKAYEMYLRTARLDLDDYNSDTSDGLHITSMGGTWMTIIEGFAGLRVINNVLSLKPSIPNNWQRYSFRIIYREALLKISIDTESTTIDNKSSHSLEVVIGEEKVYLDGKSTVTKNHYWQNTTV